MKDVIKKVICEQIFSLYGVHVNPIISRPDENFGDYTTNICFELASQLHKNPRDLADSLIEGIRYGLTNQAVEVKNVSNFINIKLSDTALTQDTIKAISYQPYFFKDQVIVCEYSDPNPFKVLHIGHLYTSIVGNAIANLYEAAGAKVYRVNFGGDIGLHVARTIWGIIEEFGKGDIQKTLIKIDQLDNQSLEEKSTLLAKCYVFGTRAYENEDSEAYLRIRELNIELYAVINNKDHESDLAKLYWHTREWSYAYFKEIYKKIQITSFDKFYPESELIELAQETINKQLKNGVYEKSDGAIVFKAEKYGLHTRVFITSQGLPSYEAKDIGLIIAKYRDFKFDKSVVITGNEQTEYMKVVLKSLEEYEPKLVAASTHLTHGIVKMVGGVKISSRKGNGISASSVIEETDKLNFETTKKHNMETTLGAIKYSFLKQRLGPDLIYNPIESVSIIGNSGPYLQYSHARSKSILKKCTNLNLPSDIVLDENERKLARKISEYPDYLDKAINEIMPHHLCTYLYELAQTFNRFYEVSKVVGDEREPIRANLVKAYSDILKKGLAILSISAPNQL